MNNKNISLFDDDEEDITFNKTEETSFKPYKIKVNTDLLRVRKEPGLFSDKIGLIHRNEIYTIEAVQDTGSDNWGKLQGQDGWISLSFTEKC